MSVLIDYEAAKKRLARLLYQKSYMEGDFTLTSGKKSDFYFDCRQTSLNPEGAFLIGSLFFHMLSDSNIQGVAGMTMGADPLITATSFAAYSQGVSLPGLIVRKEAKTHGTGLAIEGLANVQSGDQVAILEDVVSTGGSVLKACKRVEEAGLYVTGVYCILNREQGGEQLLQDASYPLTSIFTRQELVALGK